MLSVCAWFALKLELKVSTLTLTLTAIVIEYKMRSLCVMLTHPNNRTGLIVCTQSAFANTFAVTFHVALLEVSWEAVEILIVWKQSSGLSTVEVRVPNAQQRQNDWSLKLSSLALGLATVIVDLHSDPMELSGNVDRQSTHLPGASQSFQSRPRARLTSRWLTTASNVHRPSPRIRTCS